MFEERLNALHSSYNFPSDPFSSVQVALELIELALRDKESPVLLDVGCGKGIVRDPDPQQHFRTLVSQYIGIEPDSGVQPLQGVFDVVHNCLLEDAPLKPNSIDVAYAFFVVEHIQDPARFLAKIKECLKPGGVFIFLTPNAKSYFGQVCYWSERLGIDEWLLRLIKSSDDIESYHYPIAYKLNSPKSIEEKASEYGLSARVITIEGYINARGYFPGPLRLILKLLKWKRRKFHNPNVLIHLIGVIQKK